MPEKESTNNHQDSHEQTPSISGDIDMITSRRAERLRGEWDTFDHHKPDIYIIPHNPHTPPKIEVVYDRETFEQQQKLERRKAQLRQAKQRYRERHPEKNREAAKKWYAKPEVKAQRAATRRTPEVQEQTAAYNRAYFEQRKQDDPDWLEQRRRYNRERQRQKRAAQRETQNDTQATHDD